MAERIKLNKVSLREQKLKRGMYERFLPALEARKDQFLMQLAVVRKVMKEKEAAMEKLLNEIRHWSQLYNDMNREISYFVSIKEIKSSIKNISVLVLNSLIKILNLSNSILFFS